MGLFDWLRHLLFGEPDRPRRFEPGSRPQQPAMRPPPVMPAPPPVRPAPPPAPAQRQPPAPRPAPKAPAPPPRAPQPAPASAFDPGQFAPATDDETRREAQALAGQWNRLFGRTDLIPPANDPRTAIIDRAMVAHGLITPEELVDIHQVGQQMDAVRPDVAITLRRAEQASSAEARRQLRERKKAEAEERRQKHAAAVAQRKQNDIIFLGRGVSAGLADRTADADKLRAAGLPVLATPADVAAALGLSIPRLRWLAFHSEAATRTHYIRFTIPKRSGGLRQLWAPHEQLASVQQWILENILQRIPAHDAAHGFIPGRSTVTNARPHVGRAILVNADLVDFFPSITFGRVAGVFRQVGYSPAVATILALLCTESPRRTIEYAGRAYHVATGPRCLPQGACTSPALSNLVARNLDARLSGIARKLGWNYTRYADDLTLSADAGPAAQLAGYVLARLRHITQDEGFAVNEEKTHVQRPHMRQVVTGVVVNRRPGVDRALVRRLRAILHQAKKTGLDAQNREQLPHFKAWLRGMIAYIHMVNPDQAKPLWEALQQT